MSTRHGKRGRDLREFPLELQRAAAVRARNGLDPVECLKKLEGHVFGVHLKDIDSIGNTKADDLVVGTGKINFPAIFSELNRQKFSGMFSIERENNWYNNVPDVVATVKYFKEQTSKL